MILLADGRVFRTVNRRRTAFEVESADPLWGLGDDLAALDDSQAVGLKAQRFQRVACLKHHEICIAAFFKAVAFEAKRLR